MERIKKVVNILRPHIGYSDVSCIWENYIFACFLHKIGIETRTSFGECIVVNKGLMRSSLNELRAEDEEIPVSYHIWLNDKNNNVLDMAIGSWFRDVPNKYRKDFVYGRYQNKLPSLSMTHKKISAIVYKKIKTMNKHFINGHSYREWTDNEYMTNSVMLNDFFNTNEERYTCNFGKFTSEEIVDKWLPLQPNLQDLIDDCLQTYHCDYRKAA